MVTVADIKAREALAGDIARVLAGFPSKRVLRVDTDHNPTTGETCVWVLGGSDPRDVFRLHVPNPGDPYTLQRDLDTPITLPVYAGDTPALDVATECLLEIVLCYIFG